jgi:hypothetical protein
MRGAQEPAFEFDFLSSSDIVIEILSSSRTGKIIKFELFSHLVIGNKLKAISY